ncbi:small, acid-soluble spore protein, H family [Ammoniphilus oxalaticus]|uniref:Small, acid-soluble spore protein, H family n=2 Tax=Ammoniphilus oxalaticus TaxID=66863 RepID=A0A419SRF1_9BACL|nr:small, acid-soluble spore protein, H family [Ammoniphilus oxalaticus]
MNVNRAQEILDSSNKIDVQHNGTAVWIEDVDAQSQTARVYPEGRPEDKQTVAINELKEIQ